MSHDTSRQDDISTGVTTNVSSPKMIAFQEQKSLFLDIDLDNDGDAIELDLSETSDRLCKLFSDDDDDDDINIITEYAFADAFGAQFSCERATKKDEKEIDFKSFFKSSVKT
jgi:hypothetical protein